MQSFGTLKNSGLSAGKIYKGGRDRTDMMKKLRAYCFQIRKTIKQGAAGAVIVFRLCRRRRNRLILIGTPLHGNIGDHAIAIAQRRFFYDKLWQRQVIEIPGPVYNACAKTIQPFIRGNDWIVISGGGFLGSLWMAEEKMVRDVLERFAKNPVVIMPQTVFFEKNRYGKQALEVSQKIYQSHKNVSVFLRDRRSFDFMQEHFTGIKEIAMAPDMVLYLNRTAPRIERAGVLFCLRADKERTRNGEAVQKAEVYISGKGIQIGYTTTVMARGISVGKREAAFEKKLSEFRKSRLVITDRLHGMLFAAITGTPCIALDNLSGKVAGVYEWIRELDYIRFVKRPEDIPEAIDCLLEKRECIYDNQRLAPYFDAIAERLK